MDGCPVFVGAGREIESKSVRNGSRGVIGGGMLGLVFDGPSGEDPDVEGDVDGGAGEFIASRTGQLFRCSTCVSPNSKLPLDRCMSWFHAYSPDLKTTFRSPAATT